MDLTKILFEKLGWVINVRMEKCKLYGCENHKGNKIWLGVYGFIWFYILYAAKVFKYAWNYYRIEMHMMKEASEFMDNIKYQVFISSTVSA